jgi:hypothetical protein
MTADRADPVRRRGRLLASSVDAKNLSEIPPWLLAVVRMSRNESASALAPNLPLVGHLQARLDVATDGQITGGMVTWGGRTPRCEERHSRVGERRRTCLTADITVSYT